MRSESTKQAFHDVSDVGGKFIKSGKSNYKEHFQILRNFPVLRLLGS